MPCTDIVDNEALCFDLAVRNLVNFKYRQDEDDSGSRALAWTECICIFLYRFTRAANWGCGSLSSTLLLCIIYYNNKVRARDGEDEEWKEYEYKSYQ